MMQQLIAYRNDRNDPIASFQVPSFCTGVTHSFFRQLKNNIFSTNWLVFSTCFYTSSFVSFLYLILHEPAWARTLGTFWRLWCRGFQSATINTRLIITGTTFEKKLFPFRKSTSTTVSATFHIIWGPWPCNSPRVERKFETRAHFRVCPRFYLSRDSQTFQSLWLHREWF